MRPAPDGLALAPKEPQALERLTKLSGTCFVEVRVGIGPVENPPLRVLGHARCLAQVITQDLPLIMHSADRIRLFSTSPKIDFLAGRQSSATHLRALGALAGALRIDGYRGEIVVEEAKEAREIPAEVADLVTLPSSLFEFLTKAASHNSNGAGFRDYALEHAAASMFGDLDEFAAPNEVRITLGAKPEGRFWAVRRRTAAAAELVGMRVCPSMAIILRTLARPWYAPTIDEPALADFCFMEPEEISKRLDRAANPAHGGNTALKREARNTASVVHGNVDEVRELAIHTATIEAAAEFLTRPQFKVGPLLNQRIKGLK